MRIITVNLPLSYLKAIDGLVGDEGLYPSRSELIRVAVRDYLIRELESAQSILQYQNQHPVIPSNLPTFPETTPGNFDAIVRVPVGCNDENGNPEYKTYRIIKKATHEG